MGRWERRGRAGWLVLGLLTFVLGALPARALMPPLADYRFDDGEVELAVKVPQDWTGETARNGLRMQRDAQQDAVRLGAAGFLRVRQSACPGQVPRERANRLERAVRPLAGALHHRTAGSPAGAARQRLFPATRLPLPWLRHGGDRQRNRHHRVLLRRDGAIERAAPRRSGADAGGRHLRSVPGPQWRGRQGQRCAAGGRPGDSAALRRRHGRLRGGLGIDGR